MNKRAAKRVAHRFAWKVLETALDQGDIEAAAEDMRDASDEDALRVAVAYDELIQEHFNKSGVAP